MPDPNELGEFLRSRRGRVDAASAGIADISRRRVTGLRREELAILAGVSVSYYARLEQGRDDNPSPEVLDALARALRLDDVERRYLHALAAGPPRTGALGTPVRRGVEELLTHWQHLPAFVASARRDVLAATPLAGRVNPAWTVGTNIIEFTFLDPRSHDVYPDRPTIATQAVAGLRVSAAGHAAVVDPFVRSMRERSGEFRDLWDRRDVLDRTIGAKTIRVADFGSLELPYETFAVSGDEGHQLIVYFPRQGSPEADVLRRLLPDHG